MPHAVPLPRGRYVQLLKVPHDAPRREPARTVEVKGKKRHGAGVAFHLFGPLAVVLGRWQPLSQEEWSRLKEIPKTEDSWGRVISLDEAALLRQRLLVNKHIREGWVAPWWHWRRYWEWLYARLNNIHAAVVPAYNTVTLTPRHFVKYWVGYVHDRLRLALGHRGIEADVADAGAADWAAFGGYDIHDDGEDDDVVGS